MILFSVVKPGTAGWKRIQKHFGPEAFSPTGELDRKYVAKIIFNQPEKRQLLNSIIHPLIRNRMIWRIIKLFFKGNYLFFYTSVFWPFLPVVHKV